MKCTEGGIGFRFAHEKEGEGMKEREVVKEKRSIPPSVTKRSRKRTSGGGRGNRKAVVQYDPDTGETIRVGYIVNIIYMYIYIYMHIYALASALIRKKRTFTVIISSFLHFVNRFFLLGQQQPKPLEFTKLLYLSAALASDGQ